MTEEDKGIDFSPGSEVTQPEPVKTAHPNHVDFLGEVVAKHLVNANGSFGDETAKQQIVQAFRIARDDKGFLQLVNENLKKQDSSFRVEQSGAFLALTRDKVEIPLDTIRLLSRVKKSEISTPSKMQVRDQQIWDTNFRID
ncbi:MAG: hypothetical protein K2Z81_03005 [Cyanobacteria bacterium]|nr:hypothetical protein [Cyanobacteriota bacterium]